MTAHAPETRDRPARPRVLLLEDAPSLGRLFSDALLAADLDPTWVGTVAEARAALAESRPAILVVDDPLAGAPAAAAIAELVAAAGGALPVLAMSTRPAAAAPRLAELGVQECLSKPFPPKALGHRCRFLLAAERPDAAAATDPFVVAAEVEAGEPSVRTPHRLLAVVGGALRRALEERLGDEEAAADMARAVLGSPEVAQALPSPDTVLDADLSAVSLLQVLQLLAIEQQTGLLRVERPGAAVALTLTDGRLDLAVGLPGDDGETLALALAAGALLDIEAARRRTRDFDREAPLVAQAVERGLAAAADLRRAIADLTRRSVLEALTWQEGRLTFHLGARPSPLAAEVGLSLSIEGLLVEGSRRMDEWHVIERRLPDPAAVYVRRDDRLSAGVADVLTPAERAVIELLDGRTPLHELLSRARMPSYDVQSLLHRLLTLRIVRPRAAPAVVPGPGPAAP